MRDSSPILKKEWRQDLPAQILSYLPLTLFFQVGLMYAGLLMFLLAWLCSGDWQQKIARIKSSDLFWPVVALSVISTLVSVMHPRPVGEFGAAWFHYQSYWFLFPMLSIAGGAWQQAAIRHFFVGAVIAASLFYLNSFGLLPDIKLFKSYVLYEGNKSILLGLLLAIACGWMLHEWRLHKNHTLWRGLSFLYVVIALVLCTKSRTASLLLIVLCGLLIFRNFSFRWWQLGAVIGVFLVAVLSVSRVAQMPAPVTCSAKEMHDIYKMSGMQILMNRGICTVHQVRDFGQTKQVTEDGMRLELYMNTWQMVTQSPWIGHGIGNWLPMYQQKAVGQISEKMTTPHNDYLLYWFELGIGGLIALLAIWVTQLRIARQMTYGEHRARAMLLAMLTMSMMFAACFNAILRDGVFAFAMLILLAIPLAGVRNDTHS